MKFIRADEKANNCGCLNSRKSHNEHEIDKLYNQASNWCTDYSPEEISLEDCSTVIS